MIVACLTTWEPRVEHVRPALESVCDQVDVERVLLLVAPQVRDAASKQADGTRAEVYAVEDIGPGKKHLASHFVAPTDTIVTFDDDYCYWHDHASALARAVDRENCVCGFQGHTLDGATVEDGHADYLGGLLGWAYRAAWLRPSDVLAFGRDPRCRDTDDIFLGAIFRAQGRRVLVVPGDYRHRRPHSNPEAFLSDASLRFHPEREARQAACLRAAWPELSEASS